MLSGFDPSRGFVTFNKDVENESLADLSSFPIVSLSFSLTCCLIPLRQPEWNVCTSLSYQNTCFFVFPYSCSRGYIKTSVIFLPKTRFTTILDEGLKRWCAEQSVGCVDVLGQCVHCVQWTRVIGPLLLKPPVCVSLTLCHFLK